MSLSQQTRDAVQDLWKIGAAHGRVPEPAPEMDPWEGDEPRDEVTVVFSGVPHVEVKLYGDGEDTVTIEQFVNFETPRAETLALVGAVLAGDARIDTLGGRLRLVRDWLQPFYGLRLIIPVAGREPYRQRVPYQPLQNWLRMLRVEQDSPGPK